NARGDGHSCGKKLTARNIALSRIIRLSLLANPANKLLMLVAMAILVAKSLPQETWLYLAHWVTTINKVTGN
ncbi:MAG: hypothetical protein L0H99_05205, partial [Loigolactobacillus coryniformis]|uniref:hypothetical protein n=1 Tax=Loigolactobacillus coryniformis TaxID=1610 RepID=UPI002648B864